MSEKLPSGSEGGVDQSRRSFLKKGLAAAAAIAAGGAALVANQTEEKPVKSEPLPESPHDIPVESLSREEVMREIVFDEGRIRRLTELMGPGQTLDDISGVDDFDIEYFFKRYPDPMHPPTKEDFKAEIDLLEERLTALRTRRDQLSNIE